MVFWYRTRRKSGASGSLGRNVGWDSRLIERNYLHYRRLILLHSYFDHEER
jgi:hypothetical protein